MEAVCASGDLVQFKMSLHFNESDFMLNQGQDIVNKTKRPKNEDRCSSIPDYDLIRAFILMLQSQSEQNVCASVSVFSDILLLPEAPPPSGETQRLSSCPSAIKETGTKAAEIGAVGAPVCNYLDAECGSGRPTELRLIATRNSVLQLLHLSEGVLWIPGTNTRVSLHLAS